MTNRIAINGLGRIGRAILKLTFDEPSLELVAVNDLGEVDNLAYLIRFDTTYGRYAKPVGVEGASLVVASWYDNEWGFANQMLREALSVTGAHP